MKKLKVISYKVDGYSHANSIWAELQLQNIESKSYADNGFNVVEVSNENETLVIETLKRMYKNRIQTINCQDSYLNGVCFRSDYWKSEIEKEYVF
jgi:hypothetical protein